MKKLLSALAYLTIGLNGLLLLLVLFADKVAVVGVWQSAGRLHPLLLHLPIGFFVLFVVFVFAGSSSKKFRKSAKPVIQLTALLIVLTALAGLLLSREGGYEANALQRHLITGTVMSLVALILSQVDTKQFSSPYYKIGSLAGLFLLMFAGHFGAVLTHGENYVLGPLMPDTPPTLKDSSVYSLAIEQVFKSKCGSCHNPSKKKGELILTTQAGIIQGGENGPALVAGRGQESELIKRSLLPLDHDDHMPPLGKPQLTDQEFKLLQAWIDGGAAFDANINALSNQDTLKNLALLVHARYSQPVGDKQQYLFSFVDGETITQLNTPTRTVKQISTTEPALKVDFFLAQYFDPKEVSELKSVAENIVQLNLSGMPVDDKSVSEVFNFTNLEQLNLNNTNLSDQSMVRLAKLEKLKVIRLAGTAVTRTGMLALAQSKSLKEVYGWNSKIESQAWIELQKQFTSIAWNAGSQPSTEILKLTPPLLKNETFLLGTDDPIILKHNLPGTTVRYTLDGSPPDSVASPVYKASITISSHKQLRAIAVKDGWLKSNEVSYPFFVKGTAPLSAKLLTMPSKDYKANGAETFTNNTLGDPDNFRDGNWIGFKDNPLSAIFTFDAQIPTEFTIVYLQNIGSYIMTPELVEVWTGENENALILAKRIAPAQPDKYLPNTLGSLSVPLEKPAKTIKLILKPIAKLPPWHSGKGEKGWVMVSEILFR
jgi:uncharacterized membrane protein/mono/diheme cytochrome c family protein